MNNIQDPDLQQNLIRAFGVRGVTTIADTVEPSVQPVVIVRDLERPQDCGNIRFCAGTASATSGAADNPAVLLHNPAGSNTLVKITQVTLSSSTVAAHFVQMARNDTAPGADLGASTKAFINFLYEGEPVAQMRGSILSAVVPFQPFWGSQMPSQNNPIIVPIYALLSPGTGFAVALTTLLANLSVCFLWEEFLQQPIK